MIEKRRNNPLKKFVIELYRHGATFFSWSIEGMGGGLWVVQYPSQFFSILLLHEIGVIVRRSRAWWC